MVTNKAIKGVVLVSFEFPPRRLSIISDLVFKIANLLSKNNIKVWVVTYDDWCSNTKVFKKNIVLYRIPYNVHNNLSFFSLVMNLKPSYQSIIASILHEEQIDIVHFFDWQTLPLLVPWGNKFTEKLVYTTASIQATRDTTSLTNEGIKKVEQMSLKAFDLIIADTKGLANQMSENYSLDKNKIITYPLKQKKYANEILELYLKLLEIK